MLQFYLAGGYQPAEHLLEIAQVAEQAGFDGVALPDHVILPTAVTSTYPGTQDGSLPWDPRETPWLDPWVGFAAIAAKTTRLQLMSHIFVLPMRNPIHVAKTVGTLAAMFPGRIQVGVGVGWSAEEFALLGEDFKQRGARTTEAIELMRTLWSQPTATFEGRFHQLSPSAMAPLPPKPIPILTGGSSAAAFNRAILVADGFIALPGSTETLLSTVLPELWRRLDARRRDRATFHIDATPLDIARIDDLHTLDQAGVTSLQVQPFSRDEALSAPLDKKVDLVRKYAEEMIDPYRADVEGSSR